MFFGVDPDVQANLIKEDGVLKVVIFENVCISDHLAAKLYARGVKKPFRKEHGIDVITTLRRIESPKGELVATFIRNTAPDKKVDRSKLDSRYEDLFPIMMEDFRAILEKANTDLIQGVKEEEILRSIYPPRKVAKK